MRAACRCSRSGYPCQAYRVALEAASVPQTARRVAGVGCKVGQASGEFSGTFWFVRKRQPLALYRFNKIDELGSIDENMMNDIERMIENNEDDALSEYLEAWARGASRLDWHNRELARLEEEKAATTYLLQEMTAKYLRVRGRFNLHGLLEHTRDHMDINAGVMWKPSDPDGCWDRYVAQRPGLQELLQKHDVNVEEAGALLSTIYRMLSEDDAMAQDEQQPTGITLRIGPPLNYEQRKIMGCICEDTDLSCELVRDQMADA